MDYYSLFWGPELISTIDEPLGVFTCRSSILAVLNDSNPFRGLLLTVWWPEAISVVFEPQGTFTCLSSTLAIWADSGPFCGLLPTVLGSRSNSHSCGTPRCAYVSVINTSSFGELWPVSWNITHRFGILLTVWCPEAISVVVEPQGAFTCLSSTLAILADSGPFLGLLHTVLES